MPAFPEPMSTQNPYAGAAADAANAAGRMASSMADNLAATARQKQQLAQQQDQAAKQEELEYWKEIGSGKAVPFEPYSVQAPDSSGLVKRTPNQPPGNGQVRDLKAFGKSLYYPTDQEKAAAKAKAAPELDESNSIAPTGELSDALTKAGWKPGQRIKPADAHTLLESLTLAIPKDESDIHYSDDPDGTLHVFHTDKKTGQSAETATFPGTGKGTAAKSAKSYQFSYHTDDAGNVHVLRGDPDSGNVDEVKVVKGAGAKRKDPDAQAAAKPPSPGQLRAVAQKKGDGLAKAEGEFQKEMQGALTPEDRQTAIGNLTRAKQAVQNEYEESLGTLTGHDVPHFDYGSQAQPAQAPAQAAAPGSVPQGGRGANAAPAQAKPQGRIRVKLQDGRTGSVDAGEFDAKTMTRLDGAK
jgi:hypothetical protein